MCVVWERIRSVAVLKRLITRSQPCRTLDEMVNGSVRLVYAYHSFRRGVQHCDDVNDFLWCTDYF